QAGVDRRRVAEGDEIEEVVAEQSADRERPGRRRLAQRGKALAAGGEPGEADQGCDGEGDRQQLEGRQAARPGGEEREQRPEQHRYESDQGGAKSSIVGHGRRLRQGWQATARPYAAAGAASSAPAP